MFCSVLNMANTKSKIRGSGKGERGRGRGKKSFGNNGQSHYLRGFVGGSGAYVNSIPSRISLTIFAIK